MKCFHNNFYKVLKKFKLTNFFKICIDNKNLFIINLFKNKEKVIKISFVDIWNIDIRQNFLLENIVITTNNHSQVIIKGIPKNKAKEIFNEISKQFSYFFREKYVNKLVRYVENTINPKEFLQKKTLYKTINYLRKNFPFLQNYFFESLFYKDESLYKIYYLLTSPEEFRTKHNKNYIHNELNIYKKFFNNIEKKPLTTQQRIAVISNEENNLVIAGAGSGKTSVMVARVAYLIYKYKLKPNEILVLAFNTKAAKELKERIKERLNISDIDVKTFHALGLNIISQVENKKPSLVEWADNPTKKAKFIEKIMNNLIKDKKFATIFREFLIRPFTSYKSLFNFEDFNSYEKYIKDNNIFITLNNEMVKSYEECLIANFLYLNQIKYFYESDYKYNTSNIQYRQYKPDFYLPEYDIYIEHFGINKDGQTAPFIDQEEYLKGIEWKRSIHKKYNTILIETYSYENQDNKLISNFSKKLKNAGVKLTPKSLEEAIYELNKKGIVNRLYENIAIFITHYKSSLIEKKELKKRAIDDYRLKIFIMLVDEIIEEYEKEKRKENGIDFEDMINIAEQYVKNRKYLSKYKAILIDEFQDISMARAKLVKSLREQNDAVITAVGDDWQAINRYAGSDINIFYNFENFFGNTEKIFLDKTFRFNNKINEVATNFIIQNPYQLKKEIDTIKKAKSPKVYIWWFNMGQNNNIYENLYKILENLQPNKNCMILGRNKYAYQEINLKNLKLKFSKLNFSKMSVHKSKGLEADYLIINSVINDRLGFPSLLENDPITTLALSKIEDFPFAEERRLFYVALTRAKEEVHIVTDINKPSIFIKELVENSRNKYYEIINCGLLNEVRFCPKCGGVLIERTNSFNNKKFYGCINYSKLNCRYTEDIK